VRSKAILFGTTIIAAMACTETTGPNDSDVPGYLISRVIVGPEIDTLFLDPADPNSAQRLFVGIAVSKGGDVIDGIQFHWTSSNNALVVINSDGLATAFGTGTVEITASADKVGKATLVVLPAPVPVIPPAPPTP
jgi:hypothetical protein